MMLPAFNQLLTGLGKEHGGTIQLSKGGKCDHESENYEAVISGRSSGRGRTMPRQLPANADIITRTLSPNIPLSDRGTLNGYFAINSYARRSTRLSSNQKDLRSDSQLQSKLHHDNKRE